MTTNHQKGLFNPGQGNEPPSVVKGAIDKSSRLPAYAQMANGLRSAISSGEFPPGSRLPAESALAKAHGVSAMTARQAVSVLEEEGLVRRMQGKGTFVRKIGVAASSFGLDALGRHNRRPGEPGRAHCRGLREKNARPGKGGSGPERQQPGY